MKVLSVKLVILWMAIACTSFGAERVALRFDVPAGVETYSGRQPVRFGVPFSAGILPVSAGLRIVDAAGVEQPAQFEVAATWTKAGTHVRWLLIDCFASIANGVPAEAFLEFGEDVPRKPDWPASKVDVRLARELASLSTLVTGDGRTFSPELLGAEIEAEGPVRTCLKLTGRYVDADGTSIAAFETRVRQHPGMERIFHTLNWLTDDKTLIGELSLRVLNSAKGTYRGGLDGKTVAAGETLQLQQTDWNVAQGTTAGEQIDGWVASGAGAETIFAAVRWPWQQHPLAVGADASGLKLGLLSPHSPMSLKAEDVAVPLVKENVPAWNLRIFKDGLPGGDVIYNGPDALPHLTPRGISKTWEIVVWHGDPQVSEETKNLLVQHPVFGFADPEFATRAALPSPASARDAEAFPEVEAALERAFDFYTRERPEQGDFGVWNYGDLQWIWTFSGWPIYRYWMNLGKGWSITPWALWLRSGDRRYWENGEANSRHCMDVDTCHIPGWERDQNDWRLNGGQYHYSATHWGYGPEVFTYYVDSEYLPYYYYMTGYERAGDLMKVHAEALARFADREAYMAFFREDIQGRAGRHLYVMIKNLAVMYEATWDERLRTFAEECLELTFLAQQENGNFVHVKTNHYLDQPLNIAVRVFGWERVGDSLQRWHNFLGDARQPGTEGNVIGPMSLWSAVTLYEQTGEQGYLDVAGQMMRTQASTVMDSDTKWDGLSFIPAHEAGPALRDWPIAMSALQKLPAAQREEGFLPMAGFASLLPVPEAEEKDDWGTRHVMLVLAEKDKPFELTIRPMSTILKTKLQIFAPDGAEVLSRVDEWPRPTVAYDGSTIRADVAPNGKLGVYTVILTMAGKPGRTATIHALSSTGKLLHYMPQGTQVVVASGMSRGGQFWFEPLPDSDVSFGLMVGNYIGGRTRAFAPDGSVLAETRVTGSREWPASNKPARTTPDIPVGKACTFRSPANPEGLYSFIAANTGKDSRWIKLEGMRPYIAATQEAWFSVEAHPHADLTTLLENTTP